MRPPAGTLVEFPAPPPPGSRIPSRPPHGSKQPRDPLDVVREAIGELDFLDNPQAAAAVCSAALALGLGARGVIIHAHDARANEVRIVAANGPSCDALVGKAALVEDDVIASTVIANAAPMTLVIDPIVGLLRHAPGRLKAIGATRAVVAMPALVKKRVVAIIEVVDAKESAATAVEPAAQYAAIQLARFLVSRKAR